MANRLFQGVIHQMKDVVDRTIGVLNSEHDIIACSDLSKIGERLDVGIFVQDKEFYTDK